MNKEQLYVDGLELAKSWCHANGFNMPEVKRLTKTDRLYHLATCAYYRPETISIMVEKCAHPGYGGRAWSWPGYAIDRTPYGVIQHELGHHVDYIDTKNSSSTNPAIRFAFSFRIYSEEPPLTGYLGTDNSRATFYSEWFAEHFRLFVTNPDLSQKIAPKFNKNMRDYGFRSIITKPYEDVLIRYEPNERICAQAAKKIQQACPPAQKQLL